jgi:galactose-1-phosphate uridylyltransferase
MPELRQNFFTKEWVIIATERAKRPEDLATHRPPQTVPSFVETCPFCPGNESKTPAEIMRYPANTNEPWAVRVIPNKFAALSRDVQPTRSLRDVWRRIEGFGFHEVIIDSPDHSAALALLPDEQVARILHVYKERYSLLGMDRRINLLAKLYVGLENPDLNFTIRSGPSDYGSARHFHWYVSVIPRLTRTAGFELGSGMFINTVLPEAAAEFLRNLKVEKAAGAGATGG